MKTKGRRSSHNVELADSFGTKSKVKYDPTISSEHFDRLTALAEEDIRKAAGAPPTKRQKINQAANQLNAIHGQGRTPLPSPRGQQPKQFPRDQAKPRKKETSYPGVHTANKTTKSFVAGLEKRAKDTQPPSFSTRKGKSVEEIIKNDKRLEELRNKAAKKNGRVLSKPKYDKKTGKKLP